MNPIHLANDQSTHPHRRNQVITTVSVIVTTRHRVDVTKNRREDEAQVAAVTVAVTHVTRIDLESIQIDRDATGHHLMIAQADRVKAATSVINTLARKATREVIATNEVDIEQYYALLILV